MTKLARKPPDSINPNLYWAVDRLLGPKYSPQLQARGGEHLVFVMHDPKHQDTVVKVNYNQSYPLLEALIEQPKKAEAQLKKLHKKIYLQNERLKELQKYFGKQSIPAQLTVLRDVPVSQEAIKRLFPGVRFSPEHIPQSMPAWITVQRKLDLSPEKAISLSSYYLEPEFRFKTDKQSLENFSEAHQVLGCGQVKGVREEAQFEIAAWIMDDLEPVVDAVISDVQFKRRLQETVKNLIVYITETGNILDLAGKNNMVMVAGKDGWELKMPDVLSYESVKLSDLLAAAETLRQGKDLDERTAARAMYALNTIRVINALAILSGAKERLAVSGIQDIEAKKWIEVFGQSGL